MRKQEMKCQLRRKWNDASNNKEVVNEIAALCRWILSENTDDKT